MGTLTNALKTGCRGIRLESQGLIRNLKQSNPDQYFYGNGKLLLSGEYFVLDGAKALALPTVLGQSLSVWNDQSFDPKLHWISFGPDGKPWVEACFELWHFDLVDHGPSPEVLLLQKILKEARKKNPHFLREKGNTQVQCHIDFPLEWGLGSSSTLIYNVARWAHVDPFELLFNTFGGSGYDIACAQSSGPVLYEKRGGKPSFELINFDPSFKDNIYFVYQGSKQNSKLAIEQYKLRDGPNEEIIKKTSEMTLALVHCREFEEFIKIIKKQEQLVSKVLNIPPTKMIHFSDFWGEIKSLGAWGGDFCLVASDKTFKETEKYFQEKNFPIVIPYSEIILGAKNSEKIH